MTTQAVLSVLESGNGSEVKMMEDDDLVTIGKTSAWI